MHQDCKVASSSERPPPKQFSRHIQPTFEIIPFTLTNTNIHHDALNSGSPTKHNRSDSDSDLEKLNININVINVRSAVSKETHWSCRTREFWEFASSVLCLYYSLCIE